MRQIICMKWGTKYPSHYVNKLYGMASRNMKQPFRMVCMTDDPKGVRPEVECMPCPSVKIPPPADDGGWRKIALFAPTLPGMEGDWLFLDLDLIITGGLDDFFDFEPEKTFVVMHNWTQPNSGIGNTSCYRFRVGSHPYLLPKLEADFANIWKYLRNEQTYVSKTITEIAFWPDDWCILFKVDCIPSFPVRWWKAPYLPPKAKVVAFPGLPNPDDAEVGRWPAPWYKKLYKTIRPTKWITEHWKE